MNSSTWNSANFANGSLYNLVTNTDYYLHDTAGLLGLSLPPPILARNEHDEGFFRFDGDLDDETGSLSPTFDGAYVDGVHGQALTHDTDTDFDTTYAYPFALEHLCLMFHAKNNTTSGPRSIHIKSDIGGAGTAGWDLHIVWTPDDDEDNTTGKTYVTVSFTGEVYAVGQYSEELSTTTLGDKDPGAWHRYVVYVNGTSIIVYIDDILVGTITHGVDPGEISNPRNLIFVLSDPTPVSDYISDTSIDNLRIFSYPIDFTTLQGYFNDDIFLSEFDGYWASPELALGSKEVVRAISLNLQGGPYGEITGVEVCDATNGEVLTAIYPSKRDAGETTYTSDYFGMGFLPTMGELVYFKVYISGQRRAYTQTLFKEIVVYYDEHEKYVDGLVPDNKRGFLVLENEENRLAVVPSQLQYETGESFSVTLAPQFHNGEMLYHPGESQKNIKIIARLNRGREGNFQFIRKLSEMANGRQLTIYYYAFETDGAPYFDYFTGVRLYNAQIVSERNTYISTYDVMDVEINVIYSYIESVQSYV